MTKFSFKKQNGLSLIELILAIALFGLFATALIGLVMNAYGSDLQAAEKDKAVLYAQEGLEAVMSIKRNAWNLLVNGNYGVDKSSGHWQFSVSPNLLDDKFNRLVTVSDACRDGSNNLVDCSSPGSIIDLHTKKISSKVTYTSINLVNNETLLATYVTTWQSKDWQQTDWSAGNGQAIWSNPAAYFTDDGNIDFSTVGEIKLKSFGANCGTMIWPFDTPSDYTYDQNKIEVTNGFAQLKSQGGTPASGQTLNSGFNSALTPWTFNRWGTANATGSRVSSGGNPGGYAQIQFPNTRNQLAGGYFQQAFTVTAQTITSATLNLDWLISQYTGPADSLTLYAFVDTVAGAPTLGGPTQVWTSGNQTATKPWTNVSNIDVTSKITGPGTYYLKIVAYVDYATSPNRRYTVGFDNVILNWNGTTSVSYYPTIKPTIQPTTSYIASGIDTWSSFIETAQKNGGEIYYQLSDDDGASWQYYNGTWQVAGANNYNTATEINTNISSLATTTGKLMFKAFLASDGTQQVKLDSVALGWDQPAGAGGYATAASLESSAFNTGNQSAFNFLSWTEIIPSSAYDIQVQLATAPNNGGSPGAWSDWLGPTGVGSFYTSGNEILIPLSNGHNNSQWVKYKVFLSGDGLGTPVLNDLKVNYTP